MPDSLGTECQMSKPGWQWPGCQFVCVDSIDIQEIHHVPENQMLIAFCACCAAVWTVSHVNAVFTTDWNTLFPAALPPGPWFLMSQQQCMCFSLMKSSSNISSRHRLLQPRHLRWGNAISTESAHLLFRGHVSCSASYQPVAAAACSYAIYAGAGHRIPDSRCYVCVHSSASGGLSPVSCHVCLSCAPVMYARLDSCSSMLTWCTCQRSREHA